MRPKTYKKNLKHLRHQHPGRFEVCLVSTIEGKALYAGQGTAGIRANHHLRPSGAKKFGYLSSEIKIKYRVIVATKSEALELEEKFIEKFKPEFNKAYKAGCVEGYKHSEETKKKISKSMKKNCRKFTILFFC